MDLQNPFPIEVRSLYLGWWRCFICGGNGWGKGGLAIHHILGRVSASAFNSSCVCGDCHGHIGHSQEEHRNIFWKTLQFLYNKQYEPTEEDMEFLAKNGQELINEDAKKWLNII